MGETVDIGVAELLSVLARRRHAGRLSITSDGDDTHIYLHDGKVILVSSSSHALRLGRVLVRLGIIDDTRLDATVKEQDRNGKGRPLGQILIDNAWATTDDLARAAEEQCVEALARVIVARHGTFMFNRDAKPPAKRGLLALNTEGIVLEASRRADEMMTLRAILPPASARLALTKRDETSVGLNALESRVVDELRRGTGTLSEIVQRIAVEEVTVWRTVVSLRERGVVAARAADYTEEDDPPEALDSRTLEEVVALGSVPPSDRSRKVPALSEIRSGTPASSQTIAAVTLIVREVIAAFNARLPLRAFYHYSDDHFRREGPLPAEQIEMLRHPGRPLPAEEQETFVAIRDVRLLSDERVSAILVSHLPGIGESKRVLIYARCSDRWCIDAAIEAPVKSSVTRMLSPVGVA